MRWKSQCPGGQTFIAYLNELDMVRTNFAILVGKNPFYGRKEPGKIFVHNKDYVQFKPVLKTQHHQHHRHRQRDHHQIHRIHLQVAYELLFSVLSVKFLLC